MDTTSMFPRSSGVLLHPTSLPGRYGMGDLGEWAFRFIDLLEASYQHIWQVLPLGPTSYGDSPYQCLSSFAGNPLLINLDELVKAGWLSMEDVASVPDFPLDRIDYGWVIPYRFEMLSLAYRKFAQSHSPVSEAEFHQWCAENSHWLDVFALFMALKNENGGRPWVEWPEADALRHPEAMKLATERHRNVLLELKWIQWVFFGQWAKVKRYAGDKNIRLVGDIPIFVAHDSADVWANRELFFLDATGRPTVVAGVPPDYFSATGQRWGNPLYRWDMMAQDNYAWWLGRIRATLEMVDIIKIDHFRGFDAYWEVPASESTAIHGQWVPGPGEDFFNVVESALGKLPIIVEDLGVITPTVEALRDRYRLPGMKVLQFAWGDYAGDEPFLPHNYTQNCVVYTGTHDNNTTKGWWIGEATPDMRDHVRQYIDRMPLEINWELIRLGEASVGNTFIVPVQDVLGLDGEARMNLPGREAGNWGYRCRESDFESSYWPRLAHLTYIYGRSWFSMAEIGEPNHPS